MRRECMGPIAAYFPVQAFGWGSCWMFHWLFAGLGFSWQPFEIALSSYSGGVEGKPRMPSWSSWQTVLASALATKWFRFFCSWEQCPIPGVVDMWDRQILSRPHLPTIPKGDSLPWISIIHGAKDSVKNPKMAPCLIGSENSMPPFLCALQRFAGIDATNLQRSP